jgi:hypothetical protein
MELIMTLQTVSLSALELSAANPRRKIEGALGQAQSRSQAIGGKRVRVR